MSTAENRKQELEEKISDLEVALAKLKSQLRVEKEGEQHATIDRLEEYLGDLDKKHANLQEFWKMLRGDFKRMLNKSA